MNFLRAVAGPSSRQSPFPALTPPHAAGILIAGLLALAGTARAQLPQQNVLVLIADDVGVDAIGAGLVPVDLPEIAPQIFQSCDASGNLETRRLGQRGAGALFPLWILKYLPNMFAAHISLAFNAQGPNNTIVTACVVTMPLRSWYCCTSASASRASLARASTSCLSQTRDFFSVSPRREDCSAR